MIAFILAATALFNETLFDSWGQHFEITEKIYEEKTEHQHLIIFDNPEFGRVMALDGIIQLTTKDEFVYHEMITHTPILAHGKAKKVLIVGGGDGGALREVLRHKGVEKATLVDIDGAVIELSKRYFPHHARGAFEDPRAEVIIQDAFVFAKETDEKFDVIICDSTDPVGPGEVLFSEDFYALCKGMLSDGGILVTQNGVPFVQNDELITSHKRRSNLFEMNTYYLAPVPTYVGGFMAFGFSSDNPNVEAVSEEILRKRLKRVSGKMKYYTPAVHKGAFALPPFIQEPLN